MSRTPGDFVQGQVGMAFVHFVAVGALWFVFLGRTMHLVSAIGAATWRARR